MQAVVVDKTDLRVSRLAFGTASLHHLYFRKQRVRLLEAAHASGITHFDTAPYYGFGLAETDLGMFIRNRRNTVTIATKFGLYAPGGAAQGSLGIWIRKSAGKVWKNLTRPRIDWSVQTANEALSASLKRLRTDYVDLLLLHEPELTLVRAEELLTWLELERSRGRIRYWGLAGMPALLNRWVCSNHLLAQVLQTKDSLHHKEADFILEHNRPLQFTYGYLSSSRAGTKTESAAIVMQRALQRNRNGVVLFSTGQLDHITEMARIAP